MPLLFITMPFVLSAYSVVGEREQGIHGMVRSSRRGLHRVRDHPAPQEIEPEELKEYEPVTAQQVLSQRP